MDDVNQLTHQFRNLGVRLACHLIYLKDHEFDELNRDIARIHAEYPTLDAFQLRKERPIAAHIIYFVLFELEEQNLDEIQGLEVTKNPFYRFNCGYVYCKVGYTTMPHIGWFRRDKVEGEIAGRDEFTVLGSFGLPVDYRDERTKATWEDETRNAVGQLYKNDEFPYEYETVITEIPYLIEIIDEMIKDPLCPTTRIIRANTYDDYTRRIGLRMHSWVLHGHRAQPGQGSEWLQAQLLRFQLNQAEVLETSQTPRAQCDQQARQTELNALRELRASLLQTFRDKLKKAEQALKDRQVRPELRVQQFPAQQTPQALQFLAQQTPQDQLFLPQQTPQVYQFPAQQTPQDQLFPP